MCVMQRYARMCAQGDQLSRGRCVSEIMDVSSSRTTREVDHVPHAQGARGFARVDAMNRPCRRWPLSFSIRSFQLWALMLSSSNIPANSSEIEACPWRMSRPVRSTSLM